MEGKYAVEYEKLAKKQVLLMRKSGRVTSLRKVHQFEKEAENHPRTGTGHPEQLRHKAVETWSRKVSAGDRLVYEIYEEEKRVVVTQVLGHYDDK